jgi:hypothetical protein
MVWIDWLIGGLAAAAMGPLAIYALVCCAGAIRLSDRPTALSPSRPHLPRFSNSNQPLRPIGSLRNRSPRRALQRRRAWAPPPFPASHARAGWASRSPLMWKGRLARHVLLVHLGPDMQTPADVRPTGPIFVWPCRSPHAASPPRSYSYSKSKSARLTARNKPPAIDRIPTASIRNDLALSRLAIRTWLDQRKICVRQDGAATSTRRGGHRC